MTPHSECGLRDFFCMVHLVNRIPESGLPGVIHISESRKTLCYFWHQCVAQWVLAACQSRTTPYNGNNLMKSFLFFCIGFCCPYSFVKANCTTLCHFTCLFHIDVQYATWRSDFSIVSTLIPNQCNCLIQGHSLPTAQWPILLKLTRVRTCNRCQDLPLWRDGSTLS